MRALPILLGTAATCGILLMHSATLAEEAADGQQSERLQVAQQPNREGQPNRQGQRRNRQGNDRESRWGARLRLQGARYTPGPDSQVQEGVPQGKLEGPFLFRSDILENTVRQYWVYVPQQYDPNEPAALLVFQDGHRATNPRGVIRAQHVLDNLIHKGEIPVTIGVFITPGQRGEEFPEDIGWGNPNNRSVEYDSVNDTYAKFIVEEMIPEVEKKYKLTDDPKARVIGGSSSGAICAMTVAWYYPEEFGNVVSFIGSYTDIRGGHVWPDMILENDAKPIRVFLQDGVYDNRSPSRPEMDWYLQNKKMAAALEEKGYDSVFIVGEGGHSDDHGGTIFPHALRWIYRDYSGLNTPAEDPIAAARAIEPSTPAPPGQDLPQDE